MDMKASSKYLWGGKLVIEHWVKISHHSHRKGAKQNTYVNLFPCAEASYGRRMAVRTGQMENK